MSLHDKKIKITNIDEEKIGAEVKNSGIVLFMSELAKSTIDGLGKIFKKGDNVKVLKSKDGYNFKKDESI